jgi:DNA-binding Xre family transcriptional regulator
MTTLKITYDYGGADAATLDEILTGRKWSDRERRQLIDVAKGNLRRLSTAIDGRNCDVELAR